MVALLPLAGEPARAAAPAPALLGAGQSGVPSGRLGTCDGLEAYQCFTSMDDRPPFFVEPWEFPTRDGGAGDEDAPRAAADALAGALAGLGYEGVVIVPQSAPTPGYYVSGASSSTLVEFFVEGDGSDNLVQVRAEAARTRVGIAAALGRPNAKLQRVRLALGWDEVVVLRNRRRAFGIVQSGFDEFGPVAPLGDDIDPDDALGDGPRGYRETRD